MDSVLLETMRVIYFLSKVMGSDSLAHMNVKVYSEQYAAD
jgi:hypothetical protein